MQIGIKKIAALYAIAVFDKTWKGPAISYIGRDELEACGEAFLAQVRQQAEKLVREMAA
ncbi:TPA: DNA adenine methylase [Escherichia coli]